MANNLVKAMDRLAMAHPGFGVNVDDGQRIVEGKIPKPDPNHVDVDTEVSNITTMQPKHSSAFSRTGCCSPLGLPRQRSHDALAQTLTVQSNQVDASDSIRAFCRGSECDSGGRGPSPSGNSSFGYTFGVFEDDSDNEEGEYPPRLSFSVDETSPLAFQPTVMRIK